MNYAIIVDINMRGKLSKSFPILEKPILNYMADVILKTGIKKIYVLTNSLFHYNVSKEIEIMNINYFSFEPCISNEESDFVFLINENLPFLTLNTLNAFLSYHQENKNDLSMAILRSISIKNKNNKKNIAFSCIQSKLFYQNYSHLKKIEDIINFCFYLENVNKVGYYQLEDSLETKKINTQNQLLYFSKKYQKKILNKWIQKGVFFEKEDNIVVGPEVVFEGNAWVYSGSILTGKTTIHSNVILGPYIKISNSILYEDVQVLYSIILDSTIQRKSMIGPFSHIRGGSIVGEENRIGNFVELKNTQTGEKTYASHLAYIADTRSGSGVNFGCGAITVNYDGKSKHQTIIGDNVFIGCNTNIIAPIFLKSNSYIAAGSTIVDSLEVGDFAIARMPQTTKSGYAYRYGYKRVEK